MKLWGLFSCVLFLSFQSLSLSELRQTYPLLTEDKALATDVHEALASVTAKDGPKKWAYKGAVNTIMAKHVRNKREKKALFTQGASQLEEAVAMAPNDIEVRCLRLSVQENSPRFLGYHKNIEADKAFIMAHYSETTSRGVKAFIRQYVSQSSQFTETEKSQIQ